MAEETVKLIMRESLRVGNQQCEQGQEYEFNSQTARELQKRSFAFPSGHVGVAHLESAKIPAKKSAKKTS